MANTRELQVSCPLRDSFRVEQLRGMFGLAPADSSTEKFTVEMPPESRDWQLGLIVGPSGSGKSTVARAIYGANVHERADWATGRAIVDNFGSTPLRQVLATLTAVGLSSPPTWLKPYEVLSTGERFRCDLARALCQGDGKLPPGERPVVVYDEFTSVVDRQVARTASTALERSVRRGTIPVQFVAVTCHYDVAVWMQPDWILDMARGKLARSCLRRPPIRLAIHRCDHAAWELFRRHHYLSGRLNPLARCYLATWNGAPVHFCATVPQLGKRRERRFTRCVTLPDYQGIGIGMRVIESVAVEELRSCRRISLTASHPAVMHHCRRSPDWRVAKVRTRGSAPPRFAPLRHYASAQGRPLVTFVYRHGGSPPSASPSAPRPRQRRPVAACAGSVPPQAGVPSGPRDGSSDTR